jgi:SAM-dependent methyltransferase
LCRGPARENDLVECDAAPLPPDTRLSELDSLDTTLHHRRLVETKPFLRQIYAEWGGLLTQALAGAAPVLEIGSGPGVLARHVPGLITSDIVAAPGVRVVADAVALPFVSASLGGITMINVLHHVARPRQFFTDAARVVRPRGVLVMIEPWLTSWSRFVYGRLHHEPCAPDSPDWEFPPGGRLSAANSALPWILFERDRAIFEREFPTWRIESVKPFMPFRYLVSGGLSHRSLVPAATFGFWRGCEQALSSWMDALAMFALIRLARTDAES